MISPENVPTFEIHEAQETKEEMRQHERLYAHIPLSYQVSEPESEESWQGEGILKNISFGGVYLTCETPPHLEPGQIRNFVIVTAAARDQLLQASRLTALGVVVRVEKPGPNNAVCGIAIKFLSPLQLTTA